MFKYTDNNLDIQIYFGVYGKTRTYILLGISEVLRPIELHKHIAEDRGIEPL
jgi:hypothetical protein